MFIVLSIYYSSNKNIIELFQISNSRIPNSSFSCIDEPINSWKRLEKAMISSNRVSPPSIFKRNYYWPLLKQLSHCWELIWDTLLIPSSFSVSLRRFFVGYLHCSSQLSNDVIFFPKISQRVSKSAPIFITWQQMRLELF